MQDDSVTSTRSIRSFNTALVLQAIHREGACSRAHLARLTHLSPATVSRIVGDLLQMGIIYEERLGESTGGRRPIMLRVHYERLFVVGVQVHRSRIAIGVADLNGSLLHKRTYMPWALDPPLLLGELAHQIDDFLHEAGIKREEQVLGIGIAISGVVDSEHGLMLQSVNLGWKNVPIADLLGSQVKLPIFVENDANAGALAEIWFGGAGHAHSFFYLLTEAGVGSAIVIGQRLLTGVRGMAGEIGHIPLMRNGYRCRCGQRGCLEAYVYLPDVLDRYKERSGQTIESAAFLDPETNPDPVVEQLTHEAEEALALAVAFPVALLDLDAVIINDAWGENGASRERIQAACIGYLERTGLSKQVDVLPSGLGPDGDLLGAVGLVIDRYFSPPRALAHSGLFWEARKT